MSRAKDTKIEALEKAFKVSLKSDLYSIRITNLDISHILTEKLDEGYEKAIQIFESECKIDIQKVFCDLLSNHKAFRHHVQKKQDFSALSRSTPYRIYALFNPK